jgi:NodT family efflux transporter outer membrane factor (OMF) lipoprotein
MRRANRARRGAAPLACALALSGCMVGPDYQRPPAAVPVAYKEVAGKQATGWKIATPHDDFDRGAWWLIYDDPVLDGLEREIDISNQTLKAAQANYDQASDIVGEAAAGLYPAITTGAAASRAGSGGGRTGVAHTLYNASAGASWEIDVWGRIRRTVESEASAAQASAADVALARLSAQAALATAYFNLRAADALERLLNRTVGEYRRSLDITRNKFAVGVAAQLDVVTAQAQLATAREQVVAAHALRVQFEHAIAVLTGHPPSDLSVAPAPLARAVPDVPVTLPSELLERRPDITSAERVMQQQNALIGANIATFYPAINLSASFGYAGNPLGSLFSVANQFWGLGAAAAEPLFEGGLRRATVAASRASYRSSVATYRQTVLVAFQQVEDGLSNVRLLADEAVQQALAVSSAREQARIALNEYQAGTVDYTTVVIAQTGELASEETALSVQQNRLLACAALVVALGGGWDASQLPRRGSLWVDADLR